MNIEQINATVYTGGIKDKNILMKSFSGGAFTADLFLNDRDAKIATVYNYDSHMVEFQLILNEEEQDAVRGSKYIHCRPGDIFYEAYKWLKNNPDKSVLFVGVGCQVDGFRKFAELKKSEKGFGLLTLFVTEPQAPNYEGSMWL